MLIKRKCMIVVEESLLMDAKIHSIKKDLSFSAYLESLIVKDLGKTVVIVNIDLPVKPAKKGILFPKRKAGGVSND